MRGVGSETIRWATPLLTVWLSAVGLVNAADADEKMVQAQVRKHIAAMKDETFVVRQRAFRRLVALGPRAFPQLLEIAKTGTPEQRHRAREIVRHYQVRQLHRGFTALGQQDDYRMNLDQAMWLISTIVDPQAQKKPLSRQLDEMARRVRLRLPGLNPAAAEPRRVVDAILKVLKTEYKLRGAVRNYDHPDNSSLERVLATKKGLPIILSHIAISVAERLHVPLVGLQLPGRYMIKYDGSRAPPGFPRDDIVIDPFGDWQILTHEGVRRLIPGFNPANDLKPSSHTDTITRMLRNLASDYDDVNQPAQVALTLRCMQIFRAAQAGRQP